MQTLAYRMAARLKELSPSHSASVEVLEFALLVLINTLSTIVLALGISLITGKTAETVTALVALAVLRQVSGGIHLKRSWTCMAATAFLANIVGYIHYSGLVMTILTIVSLVLAMIYAPSRIENQTRIPEKYFPLLKLLAMLIIACNFFIESSVIASTFLVQALLLIHVKGGEAK